VPSVPAETEREVTPCIACDFPNADPSAQMPRMHVRCWLNLPQLTREMYLHGGGLDLKRLKELAKERGVSVRAHGGGRR
jgi:hypothetical protein